MTDDEVIRVRELLAGVKLPLRLRAHPSDTSMIVDAEGETVVYDEGCPSDEVAELFVRLVNSADRLLRTAP